MRESRAQHKKSNIINPRIFNIYKLLLNHVLSGSDVLLYCDMIDGELKYCIFPAPFVSEGSILIANKLHFKLSDDFRFIHQLCNIYQTLVCPFFISCIHRGWQKLSIYCYSGAFSQIDLDRLNSPLLLWAKQCCSLNALSAKCKHFSSAQF